MMYLQALVQQQNISGNLDEPEGGLDALMQVAVCEQVRSVVVRMNELPTLLELEEVRWGGGGGEGAVWSVFALYKGTDENDFTLSHAISHYQFGLDFSSQDIGWSELDTSRRLVILVTDAPFHIAGDGKVSSWARVRFCVFCITSFNCAIQCRSWAKVCFFLGGGQLGRASEI